MKTLIEELKTNEVLNALWYAKQWNIDTGSIRLSDIFGMYEEIDNKHGYLLFGKYRLIIVCDSNQPSIAHRFDSNEDLRSYLSCNLEQAFKESLRPFSDYVYVLNVISPEDLTDSRWGYKSQTKMKNRIDIFSPIISKFITDALFDKI